MVVFETERLVISQYKAADFENFFRLNGDPDIMRYIRPAKSREDAAVFFEEVRSAYDKQPGLGRWAMHDKTSHDFVGSFAVIPVKNSDRLQLGYALLKENWKKGYASEAVKGGITYMFDVLGLDEIAGITYPGNEASQKVLLKNGFVFHSKIKEEDGEMNLYLKIKDNR